MVTLAAVHDKAATGGKAKGRVLAVDDCAVALATLSASLELLGYSVLAVGSGHAALQALDQDDFDAVVLDVEMPGMDGMAVGRALRQQPRLAHLKIAMHTGLDESAVRAGFSQYDSFVPKACSAQQLGQRVDGLIRGAWDAGATRDLAQDPA